VAYKRKTLAVARVVLKTTYFKNTLEGKFSDFM